MPTDASVHFDPAIRRPSQHDFEDVVTLIDRREELVPELAEAPAELRDFIPAELRDLLSYRDFDPAGEGAFGGGPEPEARFERFVKPRIEAIVASRSALGAHD